MSRFIWIDNKELFDSTFGMNENINGEGYSGYSDNDEGLIYDTVSKVTVLDFGNNETYYPACGTKPDAEHLSVIMDALNKHDFI